MLTLKQRLEFPFITLITAVLFIACYSFKAGEAVFFGYPSYYIYLDLNSVLNLSLKLLTALTFTFGTLSFLFGSDGKLKSKTVKYAILFFFLLEICTIGYKINQGVRDYISYMDGLMTLIVFYGMVHTVMGTFHKVEDGWEINLWGVVASLMLMAAAFFLSGINYHNQLGSTLWVANDNEYVIGEYKDSFIMKKCVDGVGVFSIKDYKDNEFKEATVDVTSDVKFRCLLKK